MAAGTIFSTLWEDGRRQEAPGNLSPYLDKTDWQNLSAVTMLELDRVCESL